MAKKEWKDLGEKEKRNGIGCLAFIVIAIFLALSGGNDDSSKKAQKDIVLEQVTLKDVKSYSKDTRSAVVAKYLEVNNIPASELDKYDTYLSFNTEVKNETLKAVEVLGWAKNECAMNNGKLKGEYWKLSDLMKYQFSAWDGSHIVLERYLKNQLNDVDSYEHVETRYRLVAYGENAPYLVLYTKFRAKNGFGAVVLANATAKYNLVTERLFEFAMQ